eukprot:13239319-Heterocapsa_arctica.AAC.1
MEGKPPVKRSTGPRDGRDRTVGIDRTSGMGSGEGKDRKEAKERTDPPAKDKQKVGTNVIKAKEENGSPHTSRSTPSTPAHGT